MLSEIKIKYKRNLPNSELFGKLGFNHGDMLYV